MKKVPVDMLRALLAAGISDTDARALRNISHTLHRWHELECGTAGPIPNATYAVERETDEPTSQPFLRVMYQSRNGYVDNLHKIPDRENGAKKRLAKIMARYPALRAYIQGDPRGASLYVLRPGDVREGLTDDAAYTNGIAIF